MLMFREEKSPDDEIKAWQFWHGRQHSVKQRILDAGKSHPPLLLVLSFDSFAASRGVAREKNKRFTVRVVIFSSSVHFRRFRRRCRCFECFSPRNLTPQWNSSWNIYIYFFFYTQRSGEKTSRARTPDEIVGPYIVRVAFSCYNISFTSVLYKSVRG